MDVGTAMGAGWSSGISVYGVVVLVGVLIAAFLNSTIGIIVAVIGVVGLVLAVVSGRSGAKV